MPRWSHDGFANILDWARQQITARVPKADLDQRDPDYIRDQLPGLWMLASLYFRADIRGLQRIPAHGPVLLVGNHSGGNVPDTFVFTLAFCSYFGVERPFYQLAHNLVAIYPALGWLRKFGLERAGRVALGACPAHVTSALGFCPRGGTRDRRCRRWMLVKDGVYWRCSTRIAARGCGLWSPKTTDPR